MVSQSPRHDPWVRRATSEYSLHDGVNRQGEGRPSMARWYQSTIRIRAESGAATGRDRPAERRTTVRHRPTGARSGTPRPEVGPRWRRPATWPSAAGEPGCVRRPVRGRDPLRTPPAGEWTRPGCRGCSCTRGLRHGRAGLAWRAAQTRCAPGDARSHRQTVATLGPTGLEHVAAGAGAHPVAEAVLLGTTTIVRLVRALHAALLEPPAAADRQLRERARTDTWRQDLARLRPRDGLRQPGADARSEGSLRALVRDLPRPC